MKYILPILDWIKSNKVMSIILIGLLTYSTVRIFEAKKSCEDCGFYKKQNNDLIQALIGIKGDMQKMEAANTSYYPMDELPLTVMYASYDSIPKKKQTQQQIKLSVSIKKEVSKIDSIINAAKQQQKKNGNDY